MAKIPGLSFGDWVRDESCPVGARLTSARGNDLGSILMAGTRSLFEINGALAASLSPTDAGAQASSEPTRFDDGPQPVADLSRPANGIHNLARNPIPPNQVAAGRLFRQGAIVGRDRDDLGRLGAKALFDKLGGSHLNEGRRDRQSVLGVILRAVETAPPWGLYGYRLNGGDLVRRQDLRARRQRFDLVEVRAKRVENGGTGREKRVGPAGFRHGNRPSDRQLASPRVAPDRSPERHRCKLQTPAAAPDRHAGGKGGTSEIDLPA